MRAHKSVVEGEELCGRERERERGRGRVRGRGTVFEREGERNRFIMLSFTRA